jgi:hypothetical protein
LPQGEAEIPPLIRRRPKGLSVVNLMQDFVNGQVCIWAREIDKFGLKCSINEKAAYVFLHGGAVDVIG